MVFIITGKWVSKLIGQQLNGGNYNLWKGECWEFDQAPIW